MRKLNNKDSEPVDILSLYRLLIIAVSISLCIIKHVCKLLSGSLERNRVGHLVGSVGS